METKRISMLLILLSFLCINKTLSQGNAYMKDVSIDGVSMEDQLFDYKNHIKDCVLFDKRIEWDDELELNKTYLQYKCDSVFIHTIKYDSGDEYTKYIEIFSEKHFVKLKNKSYHVGMVAEDFDDEKLKERHAVYFKENRNRRNIVYFGYQLLLKTNDEEQPYYPCQGLKFGFIGDRVVSILVDFRTDGDLD